MKNMLKLAFASLCLAVSCVALAAPYNRVVPVLDGQDAVATGVLVTKYAVLTAGHAVSTADQLIACGDVLIKGHLVRMDMRQDLALYSLEAPCEKVEVTPLAKTSATEGDGVTIQGYPGTNTRRTTTGVVANYEVLPGPPVQRLYMLLDVIVSGGNSGGPVLNTKGELVGIVQGKVCYPTGNAHIPPTCYGTAIPLVTIKAFLEGIPL